MRKYDELLAQLDSYSAQHKAAKERFLDRLPASKHDWPGEAASAIRELWDTVRRYDTVTTDYERKLRVVEAQLAAVRSATIKECEQLCYAERDKANKKEPNDGTMNIDHLLGQGWMANLLGKKIRALESAPAQEPAAPGKSHDCTESSASAPGADQI